MKTVPINVNLRYLDEMLPDTDIFGIGNAMGKVPPYIPKNIKLNCADNPEMALHEESQVAIYF